MDTIKDKMTAILFLVILLGSLSIQLQSTYARQSLEFMLSAGSIVSMDLKDVYAVHDCPLTNLRLAVYDGVEWYEVFFRIQKERMLIPTQAVANVSGINLGYQDTSGTITSNDILAFRVPYVIGIKSNSTNWWLTGKDLGLNNRIYVILHDDVFGQDMVIYIYYSKGGFAVPPTFSEFNIVGEKPHAANCTKNTNIQLRNAHFSMSYISSLETLNLKTGQDPDVYHISTVCDEYKFQHTGHNIQNFYVEMPNGRSYAWIYVSGQSYGDGYTRLFELYVNDVLVATQYPTNSFSYSWNILGYLQSGTNKIGIKLTTYTYSPGYDQYWLVSSHINVKYSASQHISTAKSHYAPGYTFIGTGWSIQSFSAAMPNGITSGSLQVSGTSQGDKWSRRLDVFVDGQAITPSGGKIVHSSFTWTSSDITSLLAFKKYVVVGIRLTTYEYESGVHWDVSGSISASCRYEVWPDNDGRWQWNWHVITGGSASVYDTSRWSGDYNQFLAPVSFELKSKEHQAYPYMYVGIMTHVPDECKHAYDLPWWMGINYGLYIKHEIHVSIRKPDGNLISQESYHTTDGLASPTDTGEDQENIGSDMLSIISLVANGLGHPEFGVPVGIAAVLIKYLENSEPAFSYGKETNGVYLNDHRGVWEDLSDLLSFQVDLPAIGEYTISINDVVSIHNVLYYYMGGQVDVELANYALTCQCPYYYGP